MINCRGSFGEKQSHEDVIQRWVTCFARTPCYMYMEKISLYLTGVFLRWAHPSTLAACYCVFNLILTHFNGNKAFFLLARTSTQWDEIVFATPLKSWGQWYFLSATADDIDDYWSAAVKKLSEDTRSLVLSPDWRMLLSKVDDVVWIFKRIFFPNCFIASPYKVS